MVDIGQEETINPLEIGIDLFSYESLTCLEFEQRTRSYGTPNPQYEIAKPISFSPDRRGLVKRWHVCKPIHVTYDDGSGEDCGMWPTCDPDLKLCFRYNEVFGVHYGQQKINDTTRERRVFNNEIEHLSNEYILRIGKKGYVLDDVWEKCKQNYKKTNEAWHDKAYEEDEMWRSGDEKTDYDPPYVNVKTFEVKKYSFKQGRSFICITDHEDEALPLGRVNGARFKAMIRKELEGNKCVHENPEARRQLSRPARLIIMCSWDDLGFTILYYPRSSSLPVSALSGTMAGVDVDTLTMEKYLALSRENQALNMVKPEIEGNVNFKIKSQFMREMREDTFSGNKDKDAHDHIDRVINIVGLFNIPRVSKDAVMLRVFPFTLTGSAKRWVDRPAPRTINTWDLLKKAFIQRYCPPSMTAKQLEDIYNFKQEGDESLYQA
ncbi:phospholipase-like protein [Tanacetum coccineum]